MAIGIFESKNIPSYTGFSKPIGINPNYFAIALVLCINYIGNYFLDTDKKPQSILVKVSWVFALGVLFVSLMYLTSRNAIITLILVSSFVFLRKMFKTKKWKLILIPVVLTLCVFIFMKNSYLGKIRFNNLKHRISNITTHFDDKQYSRFHTWHAGILLIKEKPLIGHGIVEMQSRLNTTYASLGYLYSLKQNYHVHNQFIQLGVIGGLGLILLFVAILWIPFYIYPQTLILSQSIILTITFMTDAPLIDMSVLTVFLCLMIATFYTCTSHTKRSFLLIKTIQSKLKK